MFCIGGVGNKTKNKNITREHRSEKLWVSLGGPGGASGGSRGALGELWEALYIDTPDHRYVTTGGPGGQSVAGCKYRVRGQRGGSRFADVFSVCVCCVFDVFLLLFCLFVL